MRLPRWRRRGRHGQIPSQPVGRSIEPSLACCEHCRHPDDLLPHLTPCPYGCTGAEAEAVTLDWLGQIGAMTYWPQHSPEHDGWLAAQLADFSAWADNGWAFIRRWHVQAQADAAAFYWWHPDLALVD